MFYIDFDNLTVFEMMQISEFFNLFVDGDLRKIVVTGVKE